MRSVLLAFLVGCTSLYFGPGSGSGSGSQVCGDCNVDIDTCPFFEGEEPVACSTPGVGCEIENWEHGCSCGCGSDGWWSCFEETVGSRCPKPPPTIIDAGIDAPTCSQIEAEIIGVHPNWVQVSDAALSGGLGLVTNVSTPLMFNFTGTTFGIRHSVGPDQTGLKVTIDGATPVMIATYQSTPAMTTSPVASGLANTEHQVSIVCEGADCNVDYFAVTCN
jgi:hypothetical protein